MQATAHNDEMALGAIQAAQIPRANNLHRRLTVLLTQTSSFDGTLAATIAQQPTEMGKRYSSKLSAKL